MSTVAYDAFLPEVLPYVRDCPEFAAVNAIRNACIEFCEMSTYWRQVLDPIAVVVGQNEYDLDVEVGTSVTQIISAKFGELPLVGKSEEQLNQLFNSDWRNQSGGIQYYTQDDHDVLRVVLTPETATTDTIKVTVALRPLRSSTRVSKDIYERFSELIGFGARARLHDTPGQPYTDEQAALKFRQWFRTGCGKATLIANQGRTRGPLTVQMIRV